MAPNTKLQTRPSQTGSSAKQFSVPCADETHSWKFSLEGGSNFSGEFSASPQHHTPALRLCILSHIQVSPAAVSQELFVSLWHEPALCTSAMWGIILAVKSQGIPLIYLLFLQQRAEVDQQSSELIFYPSVPKGKWQLKIQGVDLSRYE